MAKLAGLGSGTRPVATPSPGSLGSPGSVTVEAPGASVPPPTFAHTPTWTWGSAWRSPPPGSPPTAQWRWRQPSTAAWAPGPWRGQQGAQAGGAESSGPHTQTPPTALSVPRAQGAQADVGWGRRAGDGGWGGVGSGARTHPSLGAGPGTLGRCRGACWGSVFT